MNLPKDYLMDEVRDGFYVSGKMKRCWAAQIKVLYEIDKICRKHNITYFAEWGTLLGTIRHGGYIPWDDDLDICMKREDYNHFLKVARKELPEGYAAHTYDSEYPIWDFMIRVANTTSIRLDEEFLQEHYDCPYAVGIDVFPLDYMAPTEEEEIAQYEKLNYALAVANEYSEGKLAGVELEGRLVQIESYSQMHIDRKGDIKKQLYRIADRYFSYYKKGDSKYLTQIGLRSTNRAGHVYLAEYYRETIYLPFEGFSMPVPIGYQNILTQKYGDFMKLVKAGGSHEYPCFLRQEKRLRKAGFPLPRFQRKEAYEWKNSALRNRTPKVHFKDRVLENLDTLQDATLQVRTLFVEQKQEAALELLKQCQELAITIGTAIEEKYGNGMESVRGLEQYCEHLFQVYQTKGQGQELLLSSLVESMEIARQELIDPVEIVFVAWSHDHWKSLRPYYNQYKQDPAYVVTVVLVPYFDKNFNGKLTRSHFELEEFLPEVSVTLFKDYDIHNSHPDCIYTCYGYDEYHDTISIHPDYYTKNLLQCTDKLIYVPYMQVSASMKQERDVASMQYYMNIPGVVYADKIHISNEENEENYLEYLSDIEDLKQRISLEQEVGDSEKSHDKNKKRLFFAIDTSSLVVYREKALEKLAKVLKWFEASGETLDILWFDMVDREVLAHYLSREQSEEYQRIVDNVQASEHTRYVEAIQGTFDKEEVEEADAYYGVAGTLAQAVRMKEKPVMLMNMECI